ncbi:MAG: type III pantothenate kinase [Candidatus Cloacimonetes bacterium]|jgi:type III pantothenate kinase|nr:type III pantothenate kinase [Candidatus Cloacimonadota bacterium]MDD4155819.1 type III pantothenate kinase [Candidatus Cloacimonadota bacterium]
MIKKILVIDIGNTNIVCGLYLNSNKLTSESMINTFRISSDRIKTSDEYYVLIKNLSPAMDIDYICVSSVVPSIGRTIEHMIKRFFSVPYLFVTGNTKLDMKFPMQDTTFIGADLIVNAYAAWQKYQTNCIVCDLGTATTVQLVGQNGSFNGTAILPGLVTGAHNLFEKAALLSNIQLESPKTTLGLTTKDALLSGLIKGHAFALDGFINEIKTIFSDFTPITTVATGGISTLVSEQSKNIDIVDKSLTLDGLFLITKKILVT